MDADVEPCVSAPPVTDLSSYLVATPVSFSNDLTEPSMKVRITNVSALRISGPFHLFIEGLAGRMVANPDGDYLKTPYVNLVSSTLAPGQSEDVIVYFNPDPAGAVPAVQTKPVSGNF